MVAYWQDITKPGGQESHTSDESKPKRAFHVLDNSIISKLYKLEESSHAKISTLPDFIKIHKSKMLPQQNQRSIVSRLAGQTHLFDPTLRMLMTQNNTLVIPESVLRECYKNTSVNEYCPFHSTADGQWQWDYADITQIEEKQSKSKYFWDDRALLMWHFIHKAFENNEVAIYKSAEQFAEHGADDSNKKKLIIICDKEPSGDDAIRSIFNAMNSSRFPAVSVLTNDQKLSGSLHGLHQSITHVDISQLMDAYAKYSQSALSDGVQRWSRDEMNELFALTHKANRDFHEKNISHFAVMLSDDFLDMLGLSVAKEKGRGKV